MSPPETSLKMLVEQCIPQLQLCPRFSPRRMPTSLTSLPFKRVRRDTLLRIIRQTLSGRRNKLQKETNGCAYILQLSLTQSQCSNAQITETGSFQETLVNLSIPTKSSPANLLVSGSLKDGGQVLLDDFSHYFTCMS